MKKISILLILSLSYFISFAQTGEGKESGQRPASRFSLNGEEPQIISKSARPTGLQKAPAQAISEPEHEHTADCTHNHADGEPCGTVEYNKQMRARYRHMASDSEFEEFLRKIPAKSMKQSSATKRNAAGETVYQLPIIVHIIYYPGEAIGKGHNLSTEAIYAQIDVLNEDYRRKFNTSGYNNVPVGVDTKIEFVKALYDNQGKLLPEPGIHRIDASTITDGVNVLDLKNSYFSQATGDWIKEHTFWEPNCYLNIWVMGITKPLLGYSLFPDANLPGIAEYDLDHTASRDGVVIDYRRFGPQDRGPFEQIEEDSHGRTPTHELGHFLGLRHTFGDAPTDAFGQRPEGCEYDDYVEDTPNQKNEMRGGIPLFLCGEREMVENYMGYSPEQGMNIFTKGQTERMHKVLENSPRRKELLTSTVANKDGEKIPVVNIKSSANQLYVLDVFNFEAEVQRFPGNYTWTFEDGVPATSKQRSQGVYFTSKGEKQVTLTVDNAFFSITKKITVLIDDVHDCMPQYESTLATLERHSGAAIAPGNYVTGHANVWGYKALGNRFERSNTAGMQAISQIQLEITKFFINEAIGHYNPDTLVKFFVMSEAYDSLRMTLRGVSSNFKLINPVTKQVSGSYTLSKGEVDTLAMGYKVTPEVVPWWKEEKVGTDTVFVARKIRPGDTLAIAYVRVGDLQKAFNSVDGKLIVKLDNPVWPSTKNYFIVMDLDYDYYSTYRRPYSVEFNAGLSPVNFAWVYSTITTQNAVIDPTVSTYIEEWKPFSEPRYANSWEVASLLAMLPVYSKDTTTIAKPEMHLSSGTVSVGQKVTAYLDGTKPANLTAYRWTVIKEDGTLYTLQNKDSVSYAFNVPGRYKITLTYEDNHCLQRSTTKQVLVKGIRFHMVNASRFGAPLSCSSTVTNQPLIGAATLTIVEDFKSSSSVSYTWSGGGTITSAGTNTMSRLVVPGITRKYYVDAVATDDPSVTARDSITVVVNGNKPVAKFEVDYPHLRHGDTLDIYVTNPSSYFTVKNKSENVSYHTIAVAGKYPQLTSWYVEKPTSKLLSEATIASNTWDLKTIISGVPKTGPGLYRLSLRATNQGCVSQGAMAPSVMADTASVFLNFLGVQDFGAMEIRANGKAMELGSAPPGYENSRGSYYAYIPTGDNVTLEAISNEIASIKWTNTYSNKVFTTNTASVENVRDIIKLTINVVRKRTNGQSTIDFAEDLTVLLFPESYKPTKLAVANFTLSADSICLGSTIKFENSSTNAIDFKWEFVGGEPAQDASVYSYENLWRPTRRYNQPGNYSAKLTVTSYDGSTSSYERIVHIAPAKKPRMVYAVVSGIAGGMVRNDTIFVPSGAGVGLGISGLGIKGLYVNGATTGVRLETYYIPKTGASSWIWSDHAASSIKGMVATITYRLDTQTDVTQPNRLPRVAIDALACDGITHIIDTLYVRVTPTVRMDYFGLLVNGQPIQLGDHRLLSTQSLCPDRPLTMELTCSNSDSKATTDIKWYEVNANGVATLIGSGYNLTTMPTKNATYRIEARNRLQSGFTYELPVVIGANMANLRTMNYDLAFNADTLHIPADYNEDVILRISGLVKPTWHKIGNPTELSTTDALVLVGHKDTVRYEVSAASPSGGCNYILQFVVARPAQTIIPDPTPDPIDPTKAIDIYPIPAREVLHIDSPYDGDAYIVSGNGQIMKQFQLKAGKMTLSLDGMSAGVYRLVVQQASKGKIISRNFIVVR